MEVLGRQTHLIVRKGIDQLLGDVRIVYSPLDATQIAADNSTLRMAASLAAQRTAASDAAEPSTPTTIRSDG